ncbi:dTDP-4-dehydrorhamnose 3,5-epimerase [Candidatus Daviesbacteria bacterium RIFCSPHIGHO2_01_FULL_36_37]|uniref:dTDP-4-dehydrorhamnose 3,5-epimerase n=3 Tax=Candidatus Daviesiibacteriota TaxID=1752718 RepID=A0A0G0F823_9BACT|nr:MAG: dTDP-4-dehydrorhamnose 3,5-epimerase [Candidatus Daviesbacteria bacterium GW2011_GWB1_36_5]KKQ16439.1 MAG: dTDP-4-dehydrorhamnose 3,5-epimerase [Candidatus Daviesbacteria bacterium GW2011_GWA1_36_8]OGE17772.1 MAG: dTDP-4-dehydrorhamnose 3,5-epimerase [Candidatus Daviesbacteria bacterium RIFCSPHIGHO2_01_FULL_36_37]
MNDDFIKETEIEGVLIISRPVFSDDRGFFRETYRRGDLEEKTGKSFIPTQANHSRSEKGSLRGIHIAPWDKLVTAVSGKVQQVVVDLRKDSPTFGKYVSVDMGEENWVSVFIPAGCGNSFLVLSEQADYTYLATDYWEAGKEKSIIYNDPKIGISWELPNEELLLSDKDLENPTLEEYLKD